MIYCKLCFVVDPPVEAISMSLGSDEEDLAGEIEQEVQGGSGPSLSPRKEKVPEVLVNVLDLPKDSLFLDMLPRQKILVTDTAGHCLDGTKGEERSRKTRAVPKVGKQDGNKRRTADEKPTIAGGKRMRLGRLGSFVHGGLQKPKKN